MSQAAAHRFALAAALAALVVLALPARANEALAEKHACLNCHDLNKKMVGPAFTTVAQRYRSQADAQALLAKKIAEGGSGVWGAVAMPPMPQVPEPDRRTLAAWLLGL